MQPVFVDDVVDAFAAAATRAGAPDEAIIVPGPGHMPYANIVRDCTVALGRWALIIAVPVGLLTVAVAWPGCSVC